MRPGESIDPEALYVCIEAFSCAHTDWPPPGFVGRPGVPLPGSHREVTRHPDYFELDREDAQRRELVRTQAAILAALSGSPGNEPLSGATSRPTPRTRGRPPTSQATFWRKYREAVERAGPDATDVMLATGEVFMYADERQIQRLVDRHGRPPEYRTE